MRRSLAALGAAFALVAGFLVTAPAASAAEGMFVVPNSVPANSPVDVTVTVTDANVWNAAYYINFNGWSGLRSCDGVIITATGSTATCSITSATRLKILFNSGPTGVRGPFSVYVPASTGLMSPVNTGVGTLSLEDFVGSYIATTDLCVGPCPGTVTTSYPPQPPQNVRAVKEYDANLDQDVIRVTWDPPADQGTLPVSHYVVYGGPDWGNPSHPAKNAGCLNDSTAKVLTSCVVSSQNLGYNPQLGPNVFFVKAFNGLGWSGAASSNMLDIQPDFTPPSAARNVKAVGGWHKVTVSWEKPEKRGGYPITNYLASSDPQRKACITIATSYSGQTLDANPLQCVFSNLTPGTMYTFEAQALNGNGWGPRSAASNAATPWDLKVDGYSRKWTFLKLNQEITVKGTGPGLPAGHRIGVQWRFPKGQSEGEWKDAGSVTNGAKGTFTWSHKMPKVADRKATVSVRFTSLDPITGEMHESNAVTISPVK